MDEKPKRTPKIRIRHFRKLVLANIAILVLALLSVMYMTTERNREVGIQASSTAANLPTASSAAAYQCQQVAYSWAPRITRTNEEQSGLLAQALGDAGLQVTGAEVLDLAMEYANCMDEDTPDDYEPPLLFRMCDSMSVRVQHEGQHPEQQDALIQLSRDVLNVVRSGDICNPNTLQILFSRGGAFAEDAAHTAWQASFSELYTIENLDDINPLTDLGTLQSSLEDN